MQGERLLLALEIMYPPNQALLVIGPQFATPVVMLMLEIHCHLKSQL